MLGRPRTCDLIPILSFAKLCRCKTIRLCVGYGLQQELIVRAGPHPLGHIESGGYRLFDVDELSLVILTVAEIVEELEERMGESMEEILTHVSASLSAPPTNGSSLEQVIVDETEMPDMRLQFPEDDADVCGFPP